jgi:HTH-type transcriptional regulator / antitoxin HigA
MSEAIEFSPQWAAPPGLTIAHALSERGISCSQLAGMLDRPGSFVSDLLVGRQEITADLAEGLARAIGSTPRFWLAREREYRESLYRVASATPELHQWTSKLPLKDMRRFGWIRGTSGIEAVTECLQFFGVSSLERWRREYEATVVAAAFRTSAAYETNPASVSAWLRQGDIEATTVDCAPWDPGEFQQSLAQVRKLTRLNSPAHFLPELRRLCALAGVAVVVIPAPSGCRASGAARFQSPSRAIIQLSLRFGTDDQFWFTFFHEAGHLILHSRDGLFIDGLDEKLTRKEEEANAFASAVLLTQEQRVLLSRLPLRYRDVIRFARHAAIAPGIVVGQLQHTRRIGFDRLNAVKRKLDWSFISGS